MCKWIRVLVQHKNPECRKPTTWAWEEAGTTVQQNKGSLVLSVLHLQWTPVASHPIKTTPTRTQSTGEDSHVFVSFLYAKSILKELQTPCYVEKDIKTNIKIDASGKGKHILARARMWSIWSAINT